MSAPLKIEYFSHWLASGERGLSSDAIVRHLTGAPVGRSWGRLETYPHYPHDPDDFRRCQLLLENFPLAKLAFPAMRSASPEWARLVDAWDDIHAAIEAEAPGYLTNPGRRFARRGYTLIRCAIDNGDECMDCHGTGNGEPCEKCKGTGHRSGGRCRADGCNRGYYRCAVCRGNGYLARVS